MAAVSVTISHASFTLINVEEYKGGNQTALSSAKKTVS